MTWTLFTERHPAAQPAAISKPAAGPLPVTGPGAAPESGAAPLWQFVPAEQDRRETPDYMRKLAALRNEVES